MEIRKRVVSDSPLHRKRSFTMENLKTMEKAHRELLCGRVLVLFIAIMSTTLDNLNGVSFNFIDNSIGFVNASAPILG